MSDSTPFVNSSSEACRLVVVLSLPVMAATTPLALLDAAGVVARTLQVGTRTRTGEGIAAIILRVFS